MTNDLRWLMASDLHFPYHERRYVDLLLQVAKAFKPHVVDFLGDISDQDCFSRFNDGRTDEFLNRIEAKGEGLKAPIAVEQEKITREFYTEFRAAHKRAEIFSALGNHDIRVFDYFDKKIPGEVETVTPEFLWDFDKLGIKYIHYSDPPIHRFGDIYVHHGISISKHSAQSVQTDIDSVGVSLIRGHSHRLGSFYKTYDLRQETLRGFEIGHMTDINSPGMAYTQFHNWQPGFAIAHISSGCTTTKDRYWPHIQLIHISPDFTCVVDGKRFSA
jgi:predicted phosphodiesterase